VYRNNHVTLCSKEAKNEAMALAIARIFNEVMCKGTS